MFTIKDKADVTISYPIEQIANKDRVLFFDIETTGFSRKYCNVYLIGCLYFSGNQPMYVQWLAENFNEEANVLMAFHKFIQTFDTLIHFNGNSFDIPFLRKRGEKYRLDFDFDSFQSVDIYKSVSGINHILKLENQKQKTFEQFLGIKRTDPFSGGDLIEVFRQFVETKDDKLIFPLLLHNREDVCNMATLASLLSFSDFFNHTFSVSDYETRDYKDMNGDHARELYIKLALKSEIPVPLSYNYNGIFMKFDDRVCHITVQVREGCYKYFFDNYADYYYLPMEDKAIHKSVAEFVDGKYRKKATPATCYEKFSGAFLPVYDFKQDMFKQVFLENYKDKSGYIKMNSVDESNIMEYACMIVDYLHKKPE